MKSLIVLKISSETENVNLPAFTLGKSRKKIIKIIVTPCILFNYDQLVKGHKPYVKAVFYNLEPFVEPFVCELFIYYAERIL